MVSENALAPASQLRVLIVRLGAMGDILHALPAITALRQRHPEWYLGWAVEPQWQALLAACDAPARMAAGERPPTMPLVDRVHHVPAKKWARSPLSPDTLGDLSDIRRELRNAQYDVCIDLQGAVRSALIGRLAKPGRLIGEAEPREPIARRLFQEKVETRGVHVIEQAVEVVNHIANDTLAFNMPLLPRSSQAEAWCDRTIARGKSLVLINPGAGWGAKRWPAERYGTLAGALNGLGYKVVINAGPGEENIASQVVAASGGVAIAINMTLDQLIAVTRRAVLIIAGDTGPLHLGCMLGVPVVGIFGPTDPARNGPYGVPFRVLRHPDSKRDHTRHREPEVGLLTISSVDVLAAAEELLAETLEDRVASAPHPVVETAHDPIS
jgi:heptosyltransferase-1